LTKKIQVKKWCEYAGGDCSIRS